MRARLVVASDDAGVRVRVRARRGGGEAEADRAAAGRRAFARWLVQTGRVQEDVP